MPLTDTRIRALKPAEAVYRVADTNGLSLEVTPRGARHWRYRYRFHGKGQMIALGQYPIIGLKQARAERDRCRELLEQGLNPSAERQREKAELQEAAGSTFAAIAEEFLEKREAEGAKPATLKKLRSLLGVLLPKLGDIPIAEITSPMVLKALQHQQAKKKTYVAVNEARSLAGRLFRYAKATGRCTDDPSQGLGEALISPKVKGYAFIRDPEPFGALLTRIGRYEGDILVRNGLLMLAHTFVRPGQMRLAHWSDIDLDSAVWRAPQERAKTRFHITPLSRQAVALLREMHEHRADDTLVMGSRVKDGTPISDMTFNKALRSMGVPGEVHVAHGFRKSASTLLNEQGYNFDWIERQLDHVSRDRVRGIYNAAEYMTGRTRMMQEWSDYLDRLSADAAGRG